MSGKVCRTERTGEMYRPPACSRETESATGVAIPRGERAFSRGRNGLVPSRPSPCHRFPYLLDLRRTRVASIIIRPRSITVRHGNRRNAVQQCAQVARIPFLFFSFPPLREPTVVNADMTHGADTVIAHGKPCPTFPPTVPWVMRARPHV